jgi:glycosyltransferase involved in cell wall biosynthesis
MTQQPQVLMVGTDMNSKGGVSSVISLYRDAGLFNHVQFIPSYRDGSKSQIIAHYLGFLGRYIGTLLTRPSIKLVHVHTSSYGSFTRKSLVILLARLFGKKVIIHMHGAGFAVFYQKMPAPLKWATRNILRCSDVLIALSRQWQNDLYEICQHPDIRVLYNPTVLKNPSFIEHLPEIAEHPPTLALPRQGGGDFESSKTENQFEASIVKNKGVKIGKDQPDLETAPLVHFLFMGRLGQRKGVYDIIESVSRVKADNVQIHLYGDGEIDEIKRRILAAGVSHKVMVHGWIEGSQKDSTFRQASVLLLPSYHEGLPISVLEALAYGLPVLATDVGGIAEAVEDGVNGYLIAPGACDMLANRIDQLAVSPDTRLEMGKSGYRMAAEKFDLPVIMRKLEGLYAELTGI